jgi:hypothetical protein
MLAVREAFRRSPPSRLLSTNKSTGQKTFHRAGHSPQYMVQTSSQQLEKLTMALRKKRATRRGWSKKDMGDLRSLAKKKTPARMIGRHLKRSEGAVRQKAYAVGISLSLRKRRKRAK